MGKKTQSKKKEKSNTIDRMDLDIYAMVVNIGYRETFIAVDIATLTSPLPTVSADNLEEANQYFSMMWDYYGKTPQTIVVWPLDTFLEAKGLRTKKARPKSGLGKVFSKASIVGMPTSRRGLIIALAKERIWDKQTMAEYLNLINPDWEVKKNLAAINGTFNDPGFRKEHDQKICQSDSEETNGRIIITIIKKEE